MDLPILPTTDWVPTDACTLPTAEQPLRVAEFDELFAQTLRSAELDETSARLLLIGDGELTARVDRLVAAETACCSFFDFAVRPVARSAAGQVALHVDVRVPPDRADVLAALVTRARMSAGVLSPGGAGEPSSPS